MSSSMFVLFVQLARGETDFCSRHSFPRAHIKLCEDVCCCIFVFLSLSGDRELAPCVCMWIQRSVPLDVAWLGRCFLGSTLRPVVEGGREGGCRFMSGVFPVPCISNLTTAILNSWVIYFQVGKKVP